MAGAGRYRSPLDSTAQAKIPVKECPSGKSDLYSVERFSYRAENNSYVCPEGKQLTYVTGLCLLFRLIEPGWQLFRI